LSSPQSAGSGRSRGIRTSSWEHQILTPCEVASGGGGCFLGWPGLVPGNTDQPFNHLARRRHKTVAVLRHVDGDVLPHETPYVSPVFTADRRFRQAPEEVKPVGNLKVERVCSPTCLFIDFARCR
jgi:hypothetical protein